MDKKCQYLPFQDWSVKCKKMVDTGILILVQLGKQVLVTARGGGNPLKGMGSKGGVIQPPGGWGSSWGKKGMGTEAMGGCRV